MPKDAFDILYTLLHYDRGTQAAVECVRRRNPRGNAACADAVAFLNQFFRGEQSSTPVRAASFVLGPFAAEESEALRFRRLQIQQDMVDAGGLLRAATQPALA